ncbi:MAG: NAD(P)/FAD-dependent oxidoreductase [Verrucomicrobiota bacterium]
MAELEQRKKRALIVGAGPAGLTAAYELLTRTDVVPVVFEMSQDIGGISKTVNYKGNRIDIGGHRFFSKSDRVMDWWCEMLPIEGGVGGAHLAYQGKTREMEAPEAGPDATETDRVMLVRSRLSRILYGRKLYSYPISLSGETIRNLGLIPMAKIGFSYLWARLRPVSPERSLEDFIVNRFGRELYETFFEDYTEKVWGVPCREISAEWGAQRIKGLSITKAVSHALKSMFSWKRDASIGQKGTETSLIGQFLYPKLGPGQMWEYVAERVKELGGEIRMGQAATGIEWDAGRVTALRVTDAETGVETRHEGDYLFSTMPVCDLIASMGEAVPGAVKEVAGGLEYRDFITVGVLLKKVSFPDGKGVEVRDNWIYVQERDVKVGRLQIFNNWSPYMVKDAETIWLGMEYFCNEGDALWEKGDEEFMAFAVGELEKIGMIEGGDVLDHTIIRMPKTYPAYFGSYDRFDEISSFTNGIENLYLLGRNGMHKYNNADHSMLTAMVAVDGIAEGKEDKEAIWKVNTEMDYHEEKGRA